MQRKPDRIASEHTQHQVSHVIIDLESYIDKYYDAMEQLASGDILQPSAKRKETDSTIDTDGLETREINVSVLDSAKLELLLSLKEDVKDIWDSLEFAHHSIVTLQTENHELKASVKTLNEQIHAITIKHKLMKEAILDS